MRNEKHLHPKSGRAWSNVFSSLRTDTRGSQILEFALLLPLLAVMVTGVFDFGGAFIARDKFTNAVREGARLAVRQSTLDLGQQQPASIIAIHDVIANYLADAGMAQCAINVGPTQANTGLVWNYTSTSPSCGNLLLTVDRGYVGNPPLVVNGSTVIMTRISLQYPYRFMAFHKVIRLIAPNSNYSGTLTLNAQSIMQNLN